LTQRYNSYEELKADAPQADCYIAGSDQIWNTLFRNGRDAAFYMDFGAKDVKRISYSASFATPTIVPEYRDFVSEKLKGIDAISIRERISLPLLAELGRKDGVAVCDPVFLLDKEEWNETLQGEKGLTSVPEKYVLVYLTDKGPQIEKIAQQIKLQTGWKICSVGSIKANCADKSYTNAGPLDFVRLIRDAQFVISNSFHATAFSLIMGTKFCVVNRADAINERMKSILEDYGLSNRLVSEYSGELLHELDLNALEFRRREIVDASKKWLNMQLS
jgi:polysaccharide pyruvyl transferase WcaK-like protein